MTTKNDGGPAYPLCGFDGTEFHTRHEGMSLRDFFASQALAGYLASLHPEEEGFAMADHAAQEAYTYADAMLKARGRS